MSRAVVGKAEDLQTEAEEESSDKEYCARFSDRKVEVAYSRRYSFGFHMMMMPQVQGPGREEKSMRWEVHFEWGFFP